jgi:nitroreductase
MAFNDRSTPLSLLRTRRSGKPRDMVAPGPDAAQLREFVAIAMRTPDHGKLAPWRFVIVPDDARDALADALVAAQRAEQTGITERHDDAARDFARQAPALVVALSSPVVDHKIPVWEQQLSAGAACMNLLHAVHAHGYVGSWITGWAAYSDRVRDLFGAAPERIAGFLFIGSPGRPLEERARGDFDGKVTVWQP